jgi:hypothetical protein
VEALVAELCRLSPEFAAMWRDNDVRTYGEGVKHLRHPIAGPIAVEYSAFAVDGQPDLGMVIYNPATSADADRIRSLIKSPTCASVSPITPPPASTSCRRLDIDAGLPKTSSSASNLSGRPQCRSAEKDLFSGHLLEPAAGPRKQMARDFIACASGVPRLQPACPIEIGSVRNKGAQSGYGCDFCDCV